MNDYITYCAQAKLLHLMRKSGGAVGMKLTFHDGGGISIESAYTKDELGDIIISQVPTVTTDLSTFKRLNSHGIDFDYNTSDFIISREPNVIPTHA